MDHLISILAQAAETANGAASGPDESSGGASGLDINPELLLTYGVSALKAVLILFVGWLLASWVRRLSRKGMERAGLDLTLAKFLSNLAKWVVLALVIIMVLGVFGIETTSFAALIAAAGLAIGLGFQGALGNMAAGVMLLVFRPFKVGDAIKVADVSGLVDEISLFTTIIDTFDNRRLIVPNGSVFGTTIENITYHPVRRVDVNVGVEYGASIDDTRAVLEKVVEQITQMEGAQTDPEPAVVLGDLGDSAVGWTCRVWATREEFWNVKQALTREIKAQLDSAGLGIPFPQMDVHIDGAIRTGE